MTKPLMLLRAAAALAPTCLLAEEPELSLELLPARIRVGWTTVPRNVDYALTTRRWQLQRSEELESWRPEGPEIVVTPGDGIGSAFVEMPLAATRGFFRVVPRDEPAFLAADGAEVMGFTTAMDERMARNTAIGPKRIPVLFPTGDCLGQISFDVAQSSFWPEWNTDPAVFNAPLPSDSPERRLTDFRLGAAELSVLRTNGFVVSEARGAPSFTDLYHRIWSDDLPVYVSSDSILHAWHRTWITMLEELEELALRPRLVALMDALHARLASATVPPALAVGRADALEFAGVARTLVNDTGASSTSWAGMARTAIGFTEETMFGSLRSVDWTQFGPRAHYTNSETLKSYFRGMMWLGQTDMRIDRSVPGGGSLRELAAAVVLTLALEEAGLMDEWLEIDGILTPFMGRADSLTPPQLLEILDAENLGTLASFTGSEKLEGLLEKIKAGDAGVQQILGHPIPAPIQERLLVLPRSFTFFGQRFTPESWAFGRMVFDRIWRQNRDPSGPPMVRVHRRLPSALDINFAVLGNNTPAQLLSKRMLMTGGVPYRDGHDFARELVSVRQVIDSQGPAAWSGSLYLHSLRALRTLSAPLPASAPEAMRTEAWKWKTVHTQLASWTELRHDNLLYAKQSYTPPVLCFYPTGYVEPRPEFFAAMKQLVDFAHATVSRLPLSGTFPGRVDLFGAFRPVALAPRKSTWLDHLARMSASLESLTGVAQTELDHQPFTAAQMNFVQSLVHAYGDPYDGRTYSGWYPNMYLKSVFAGNLDLHPSEIWDPLVADIHTDAPDTVFTMDPGAVLYNATGNAAFMLVAIDVNGQRCLHGGPVFTYYEFTGPFGTTRLNDQVWKTRVRQKQQPAPPEWTSSFLVPGPITVPPGLQ